MARQIVFVLMIAAFAICIQESAVAQRGNQRKLKKYARFLGGGWSAGYHWENPGHRVDYYNPYSKHNSQLRMHSNQSGYGGQAGGCGQCQSNGFDDVGTFQTGGFNNFTMPIEYSQPSYQNIHGNVVDSVVDEQQRLPEVKYGPQPETVPGSSSINKPAEIRQPVRPQSSPSDVPAGSSGKDVSLWREFDKMETLNRSFGGGGR